MQAALKPAGKDKRLVTFLKADAYGTVFSLVGVGRRSTGYGSSTS
jgi:hypothetical protein